MTLRRLALLLAGLFVLAGCQLDVVAEVVVDPDGTGMVFVTAEADAELVAEVPTLVDELDLDDVAAAGWVIDGPNPTPTGGLVLTLTHDFEGKDEATNLLRSLGPPFNDPVIGRGQDGDSATNTARTNLGLPDGFATFADDDLVSAVGDIPFASRFEAAGANPVNSLNATLILTLPGELVDAETNAEVLDDGRLQWTIPMDGTILEASGAERTGAVGRRRMGASGRNGRPRRPGRLGGVHDAVHRLRHPRPVAPSPSLPPPRPAVTLATATSG